MENAEFFVYGILLIAAFYIIYHFWEKHRTSSLRIVAKNMGLEFNARDSLSMIPERKKFPLLSQGYSKKIINRISGPFGDGEPVLFGYKYKVDTGDSSFTYSQTVAWLQFNKTLPSFELRPERLLHKIKNAFGHTDINFRDRPVFSKQYLLKGDDSSGEVSSFFSSNITAYFEKNKSLCVESSGTSMLVYFDDRRMSAEEMPVFYRQAKNIYSLFDTGVIAQDFSSIREQDASEITGVSSKKIVYAIIPVLIILGYLLWFNIDEGPDEDTSVMEISTSKLKEGWLAYERQDYINAIELFSKHIENEPDDKEGYYYRAISYKENNSELKALDDFLKTIEVDPKYFDAYLHIDAILAKQSRFDEIANYWTKYLSKVSNNGRAYMERGGAYLHAGKRDLAMSDAKKACDLGEKYGCQVLGK